MLELLALSVLAQHAAPKKSPDPALVEELIRRTNDLRAFVAVYKSTKESETSSFRIAYRAPDQFRVEGLGADFVGRGEVLELRLSPPDGKSSWGRVSSAEVIADRTRALSEAVSSEYPAIGASWNPVTEWGPVLEMRLSTIDEGRHDQFDISFEYLSPRPSLLGWLEDIRKSSEWSAEGGEHFVTRTPRGTETRVSASTGFLESVHREDDRGSATFELESLDLAPKLEPADFEFPEPTSDAEDQSEAMAKSLGRTATLVYGNQFFAWITESVVGKKIEWDAGAREHARKVMQALLSVEIASEERVWIGDTEKWIDGVGKWIVACRSNGGLSDGVESQLHDTREGLLANLRNAESSRPPGSVFSWKKVGDSKLWKELEDLAEEAWTAAFTRIVHDPLVNSFDDMVERAKSGG